MQTAPFDLEHAGIAEGTLGEVLGALSHALDLAEGHEPGHCVRACFIGTRIGQTLGLDAGAVSDLYCTLLLKDLGGSSNAALICRRFMADDQRFKTGFKTVDGSVREAAGLVLRTTATDAPPMLRVRTILDVLRSADGLFAEVTEARSRAGAEIARRMRFSDAVVTGIAGLDEHWDGGGRPRRLAGDAIPLLSRIALLAQVMELFSRSAGPEAALRVIAQRSGTWFDPDIVRAARVCAEEAGFWETLAAPGIDARVVSMQPLRALDDDLLDDILRGFARVIDAKSSFTHAHSERVALYARLLAEELSLGRTSQRWIWRTALMHDIGKLDVSNRILDKTEKLTDADLAVIRRHPILSQSILDRVRPLRPMARIAGAHHERLDGRGYPHGLSADGLTQEMRILAVADIFDALSVARPYKPALPPGEVRAIMDGMSGTAIDGDILQALWAIIGRGRMPVPP